jgi:precorrin-2 methylase
MSHVTGQISKKHNLLFSKAELNSLAKEVQLIPGIISTSDFAAAQSTPVACIKL